MGYQDQVQVRDEHYEIRIAVCPRVGKVGTLANATAIAALPELLEAAKVGLDFIEKTKIFGAIRPAAALRAAIRKAEGGA